LVGDEPAGVDVVVVAVPFRGQVALHLHPVELEYPFTSDVNCTGADKFNYYRPLLKKSFHFKKISATTTGLMGRVLFTFIRVARYRLQQQFFFLRERCNF
jgi:hypothetical protein